MQSICKDAQQEEGESFRQQAKESIQPEVNRVISMWAKICGKANRTDLVWRSREIERFGPELAEVAHGLLSCLSDDQLEGRLMVICRDYESINESMSDRFAAYNQYGISLGSFVKYAPELIKIAAGIADRRRTTLGVSRRPLRTARELLE